jgi:hypothetical protein
MDFNINFVPVFVAAVAGMVIGFAWYSKFLFGKMWIQMMDISDSTMKKGMGKSAALGFVAQLVMAYVLAHFVQVAAAVEGSVTISNTLMLAFWIWLGFVATVMIGVVLWEGKPWKLYLLNIGYQLVALLAMASILAAWM